ncbi:MAG: metallophosphoesterase [Lachnospiraceae bacterium]|nr:metallophosphoesterase [Lachnospiraceae bacterium]
MSLVVRSYTVTSRKLTRFYDIVFLSDLHGMSHGKDNERLLTLCRECRPDMILCGGDMMTARFPETLKTAGSLFSALCRLAPVYAAFGNHESYAAAGCCRTSPYFNDYLEQTARIGVSWLVRGHEAFDEHLVIGGFEAPIRAYRKFSRPVLTAKERDEGSSLRGNDGTYTILMAHNPYFAPDYLALGCDLTLSGHYHGGLICLTDRQVLVSPYGWPLPRFGHGRYDRDGRTLIVSAGLGDHALPLRLHNPMEIVHIKAGPAPERE